MNRKNVAAMRITASILLLSISALACAQENENSLKGVPVSERLVFGGGFGLGFGNQQDFVMVSPSIGYLLNRKLMAGTSITYRYTNYKVFSPSLKFNDYGVSPFLRYMLFENIFLQAEYEYLNYEFIEDRDSFSSFLAGGGFIQPLGNRVAFYLIALYNFSYQNPRPGEYSPYPSPLIVRAGISLGGFGF